MATKEFNRYNILYDCDNGGQKVISQRDYRDSPSGNPLTPITPLLIPDRVASTPLSKKIEITGLDSRHVVTYVDNPNVPTGVTELKVYIPYRPGDLNLTAQLREIEAVPRVMCQDYFGEGSKEV